MRLASIAQARQIDELSQTQYRLTAESLMDRAGQECFELLRSREPSLGAGAILVICGPGNNGGDALVVARRMWQSGLRNVLIAEIEKPAEKVARDSLRELQMQRCKTLGIPMIRSLSQIPGNVSLVIDGIFGVGLSRTVEGVYAQWIEKINSLKVKVVSLDSPSGLQCDTGLVLGVAIRASLTLTFGIAKPGFFIAEGPGHVGKTKIIDIGFPPELVKRCANNIFLFTEKSARRLLPSRSVRGNKSTFGRVLIVAGSEAYWGSGILASHAAFRVGAGYVTWASFQKPLKALAAIPEVLVAQLSDQLLKNKFDAVVVGPGLGINRSGARLLQQLKRQRSMKVVVDADALATAYKFKLLPLPTHWVLTPHAGELARLIHSRVEVLEQDRVGSAMRAVKKTGGILLYKGFRTVISDGKKVGILAAGNNALAKAGSGDVLSGFIGGLMAQGLSSGDAALLGSYLHGRVSEEFVASGRHPATLMPSDLFSLLPPLMGQLQAIDKR